MNTEWQKCVLKNVYTFYCLCYLLLFTWEKKQLDVIYAYIFCTVVDSPYWMYCSFLLLFKILKLFLHAWKIVSVCLYLLQNSFEGPRIVMFQNIVFISHWDFIFMWLYDVAMFWHNLRFELFFWCVKHLRFWEIKYSFGCVSGIQVNGRMFCHSCPPREGSFS